MESNVRFEDLLASARGGSSQSLGSALDICRQYLLLVANRELDEQLQAKGGGSDLVQETFFEAQRDFAKFTGSTQDEMLAWLRRILLNNVANFRRFHLETGKRNAALERPIHDDPSASGGGPELPSPHQSPSQWAISKERMDALDDALARLPDEQRQVIVLRNQQHLSFEAIGVTIGKTADAARKLWARAVERLQHELGQPDDSSSR
ncbi:MAG TPA: sigma-70 family RNA polymerase sigma factor [Pirellulaceae bacterium]|nr:sigma-70 family RNA polymerase sigma factor [Pirellulaceae bacterium]